MFVFNDALSLGYHMHTKAGSQSVEQFTTKINNIYKENSPHLAWHKYTGQGELQAIHDVASNKKVKCIKTFLREPENRYISGLVEFFYRHLHNGDGYTTQLLQQYLDIVKFDDFDLSKHKKYNQNMNISQYKAFVHFLASREDYVSTLTKQIFLPIAPRGDMHTQNIMLCMLHVAIKCEGNVNFLIKRLWSLNNQFIGDLEQIYPFEVIHSTYKPENVTSESATKFALKENILKLYSNNIHGIKDLATAYIKHDVELFKIVFSGNDEGNLALTGEELFFQANQYLLQNIYYKPFSLFADEHHRLVQQYIKSGLQSPLRSLFVDFSEKYKNAHFDILKKSYSVLHSR